jgi:hypothetical protein
MLRDHLAKKTSRFLRRSTGKEKTVLWEAENMKVSFKVLHYAFQSETCHNPELVNNCVSTSFTQIG